MGGEAVKCSPLTISQHIFCIGVGALSLLVGIFVKLLPLELFTIFQLNEEPLKTEQEKERAFQQSFRKSRSLYRLSSRNLDHKEDSRVHDGANANLLENAAQADRIKYYRKQSSRKL